MHIDGGAGDDTISNCLLRRTAINIRGDINGGAGDDTILLFE